MEQLWKRHCSRSTAKQPFVFRAASFSLGSQRTCGSAAGGLQQDHQALQVSEDSRQPSAAIHASRGQGTAANAKVIPLADLQDCSAGPGNAAPCFKVSEAQLVTFAKSWFLLAGRRFHAAHALGEAAVRRACSLQIPSAVSSADGVALH